MVRLHITRKREKQSLITFFKGRALHHLQSGHYCIATDYTLRWLDKHHTSADALAIGAFLGYVVGQPELSAKCTDVLRRGVRPIYMPSSPPQQLTGTNESRGYDYAPQTSGGGSIGDYLNIGRGDGVVYRVLPESTFSSRHSDVKDSEGLVAGGDGSSSSVNVPAAEKGNSNSSDVRKELWSCVSEVTSSTLEAAQAALTSKSDTSASLVEELTVTPSSPLAEVHESLVQFLFDCKDHDNSSNNNNSVTSGKSHIAGFSPVVDVLEPTDSLFGRGLFANRRLFPGAVLFSEAPFISISPLSLCGLKSDVDILRDMEAGGSSGVVGSRGESSSLFGPPSRCLQCLSPLVIDKAGRGSVSMGPADSDVTGCTLGCNRAVYCSKRCESLSLEQYHTCSCRVVNPLYGKWEESVLESIVQSLNSSSSHTAGHTIISPDVKAGCIMLAVGRICAIATIRQKHPMTLPEIRMLSGKVSYETEATLSYTGAIGVTLAAALRQQHLYLSDILSLFAIVQDNSFFATLPVGDSMGSDKGGNTHIEVPDIRLFPFSSLINHSCVPNAKLVEAPLHATENQADTNIITAPQRYEVIIHREVRPGDQITINYNEGLLGPNASYNERAAILQQRHIRCTCPKCVLRL